MRRQSQGGLISALTAADRKEDVAAMILVYPALCIADNARETYASIDEIPEGQAEMPVGTVGAEKGIARNIIPFTKN